mmetsp:Transcript_3343/g.8009  ORF Transcript_3343/g.8009 Transcript_3343/m.8009 type:complete len:204 (-) Transcript_3343:227-838(-)
MRTSRAVRSSSSGEPRASLCSASASPAGWLAVTSLAALIASSSTSFPSSSSSASYSRRCCARRASALCLWRPECSGSTTDCQIARQSSMRQTELPVSSASCLNEANGESSTSAAIGRLRLAASRQLTAPMLLPHSPTTLTTGCCERNSTAVSTSSCSNQPSEMYSPSDWPQPLKSNAKREKPFCRRPAITVSASRRDELLPWQ